MHTSHFSACYGVLDRLRSLCCSPLNGCLCVQQESELTHILRVHHSLMTCAFVYVSAVVSRVYLCWLPSAHIHYIHHAGQDLSLCSLTNDRLLFNLSIRLCLVVEITCKYWGSRLGRHIVGICSRPLRTSSRVSSAEKNDPD